MTLPSQHKIKPWILPTIVFSQFCCTSLWFAGNSIINDFIHFFNLSSSALGHLTSAVQFGFIIGTFLFALLTLSDKYPASRLFFISAICGGLINFCMLFKFNTFYTLLTLRFLTGFSLAGIYPIGMKIASDYFEKGLGKSLSLLVGALVLGTALPHLLKSFEASLDWKYVIITTSLLAFAGGFLILIVVPKGPYQKLAVNFDSSKIFKVFKNAEFRTAAIGYFGHMWELYAFWTFVPVMLFFYSELHSINYNISLLSFFIIGIGGLSCALGGIMSEHFGVKLTAKWSLTLSGLCCLTSPLIFMIPNTTVFVGFLLFWGMVVISDSPLFSTLIAQNVDRSSKGTGLTIVNSIGFSITILSIQMLNYLVTNYNSIYIYSILALGPIIGVKALQLSKNYSTSKSK